MDDFSNLINNIEHTFGAHAISFIYIDTVLMYEKTPEKYEELANNCHIYFIGETPRINILGVEQINHTVRININFFKKDKNEYIEFKLPEGGKLDKKDDYWFILLENGDMVWPDENEILQLINNQIESLIFKVLYIGQSYGKSGNRNALERLKTHSTLQEISLKKIDESKKLSLILVDLSKNTLATSFNPKAMKSGSLEDESRIKLGINKLFDTTEAEKVSLYEATMIRYFQPPFNKLLKDSFPSTNLKILQDCYKKDIQAIVAEFCFDDFAYRLYSEKVAPQLHHIAYFDLHDEEERKSFFSISLPKI